MRLISNFLGPAFQCLGHNKLIGFSRPYVNGNLVKISFLEIDRIKTNATGAKFSGKYRPIHRYFYFGTDSKLTVYNFNISGQIELTSNFDNQNLSAVNITYTVPTHNIHICVSISVSVWVSVTIWMMCDY